MRRETCGWLCVFCILSLWMGGVVYLVMNVKNELSTTLQSIANLADSNMRINTVMGDLARKSDDVKSMIAQLRSSLPPKTVVVNKDGCIKSECLAKVLLLVWDLRRSFALGAMSDDAVRSVKPLLLELRDDSIDESVKVLESFSNKKGYRELKDELGAVKNTLRQFKNVGLFSHFTRWVTVEPRNDPMWRDFADLEMLVNSGAWESAFDLVTHSELFSIPRVQLWVRDLEFVLGIERHLAMIHYKLIEHVNKTHEGL